MNKIKNLILGLFALLVTNNVSAEQPLAPQSANLVTVYANTIQCPACGGTNIVNFTYIYDDGDVDGPDNVMVLANMTWGFTKQQNKPGSLYINVSDGIYGWQIAEGEQIIPFTNDNQIIVEFNWVKDSKIPVPHD